MKTYPHKDLDMNIFSSTTLSSPKLKTIQCSRVEWITKIKAWYIHSMEYHTADKMDDLLLYGTTWIQLSNIFRKQVKMNTYCIIPFI